MIIHGTLPVNQKIHQKFKKIKDQLQEEVGKTIK